VICARHDPCLLGRGEALYQPKHVAWGSKLIALSGDKELGAGKRPWRGLRSIPVVSGQSVKKVDIAEGNREPHGCKGCNARIGQCVSQPNAGPEGIPHQRDALGIYGGLSREPVHGASDVIPLPLSVVVRALAGANAAKVEAQGHDASGCQGSGDCHHNAIVHRAPTERMGMADHGGWQRATASRSVKNTLQL